MKFVGEILKFMETNKFTFTLIKPYAVEHGFVGPILARINEAGFRIAAMKYLKLSPAEAAQFYISHKGQNYFDRLITFMSNGPIVAAILEKENAIFDYRQLIGATDPKKANEGTLRKLFGASIEHNAVHGSDTEENAIRESNFFFSQLERF